MRKSSTGKKVIIGIIIAVLLVIIGGYAGVWIYFNTHFYPNVTINGINSGNLTVSQLKEKIQEGILEYSLTIIERNNQQEVITAEQMGFKYIDHSNEVENLLKGQKPYLWFLEMQKQETYHLSVNSEYDKSLVESAFNNLNGIKEENQTNPEDAYLEETPNGYVVIPEVEGNALDRDKTLQAVIAAIDKGEKELSLEEADLYRKPNIYGDDTELNNRAEAMNRLARANITYDFVDREKVVDSSVIEEFINKSSSGDYTIDQSKVEKWVNEMARETDTFGLTHEFKTSKGDNITLEGGDYGWVIDIDETTKELVQALEAGAVETKEPSYLYTAMDRSSNDIGGTYVEISISEQRMWCYQDGELIVDTLVVTGNASKNWDTPKGGVWAVDAKKRNAILKGEGYAAPVDYWMPFNGDVGIHDLNRPVFGGEIYKTDGSHGCVNTPHENAKTIYEAIEIGTPVVVY